MKRIILVGAGLAGVAIAALFLSQGTAFDLNAWFQTLLSYFRRAGDKVTELTTSDPFQKALDMIAGFEGFSAKAYPDANGWSIGYGHFIQPTDPYDSSSTISESEARSLLELDVRGAENCVSGAVNVDLTVNQRAALISFVYNVGCQAFRESTMLRKINSGNFASAATEFPRWNKSGGIPVAALDDRRKQEMEVFSS